MQFPMTQQSFTQTMQNSPTSGQPRGFTQSVTVSYGNGVGQPQVQTFTTNANGQPVQGSQGVPFNFPGLNVNNTNNIQVNMGDPNQANVLNPLQMFQNLMQNMMGP